MAPSRLSPHALPLGLQLSMQRGCCRNRCKLPARSDRELSGIPDKLYIPVPPILEATPGCQIEPSSIGCVLEPRHQQPPASPSAQAGHPCLWESN